MARSAFGVGSFAAMSIVAASVMVRCNASSASPSAGGISDAASESSTDGAGGSDPSEAGESGGSGRTEDGGNPDALVEDRDAAAGDDSEADGQENDSGVSGDAGSAGDDAESGGPDGDTMPDSGAADAVIDVRYDCLGKSACQMLWSICSTCEEKYVEECYDSASTTDARQCDYYLREWVPGKCDPSC